MPSVTLSIQLPTELLVAITNEANRRDIAPQDVLLHHLLMGMGVPYGSRAVMLQGDALAALEGRLGGGQVTSGDDLVNKVERLARIEFGGHEIRLSLGELEELRWRARKSGKTVSELVASAWKKMQQEFFQYANQPPVGVTTPGTVVPIFAEPEPAGATSPQD